MSTIQVFVPVGKASAAPPGAAGTGPRTRLSLRTIGLLDNHKHNTGKVLDRVQRRLSDQYPGIRFVRMQKPEAGKGAPKQMIETLAAECQAVVNGIGD